MVLNKEDQESLLKIADRLVLETQRLTREIKTEEDLRIGFGNKINYELVLKLFSEKSSII